jgi:hypothetical protein
MEANNFNAVYGSCFRAGNFPGVRCGTGDCRPLQAAGRLPSIRRACRLIKGQFELRNPGSVNRRRRERGLDDFKFTVGRRISYE